MSITSTVEQNEKEIKKIISDGNTSKEFERIAELYYNLGDIAKRAESIKSEVDKSIITSVKSYFSDADNTVQKALRVGDVLVKVGKDSTRSNTGYNVDNVISELKKAIPKLTDLIDDIYKKHLELSRTPTSARLYVFKQDERDKFEQIISGNLSESRTQDIVNKVMTRFKSNMLTHLKTFINDKKDIASDIVASLEALTESIKIKGIYMKENNERSSLLEMIKEKKTEVSACLSEGVEHEQLHELLEEYVAASDIASTATAMRTEIAESIKDEVTNLFDVEDAILNKFLEVGDYVIVVCKEGSRVNNKKALEGFVKELSETIPEYVDVIENIMKTNLDITKVDVKPRTSIKTIDESLVESISEKIEKFTKFARGLTRVFSKYLPTLAKHNDSLRSHIDMLYEETIMSESIKGDHYCIIQPNFAIFGVGRTEDEAWDSAEEWADTTDENWKQSFEIKPCTDNVFKYVNSHGTPDEWELSDGVVVMPDELESVKEKIEESKWDNKNNTLLESEKDVKAYLDKAEKDAKERAKEKVEKQKNHETDIEHEQLVTGLKKVRVKVLASPVLDKDGKLKDVKYRTTFTSYGTPISKSRLLKTVKL